MDERTSMLLDAYISGADIAVADDGPVVWPVLYMPRGENDSQPWEALRDGTRYTSNEVAVTEMPHRTCQYGTYRTDTAELRSFIMEANVNVSYFSDGPEAPGNDYAMRRATAEERELGPLY